jgi:glyoxylate utilization-related uncharacterized protein
MESAIADVVRIGGMELRFLVDETQGSGDLVMFEMTVHPNARVPIPHYHREVDEIVYGLSGALTTTVDGKKREVRTGDSVMIRAALSITTRTSAGRRRGRSSCSIPAASAALISRRSRRP